MSGSERDGRIMPKVGTSSIRDRRVFLQADLYVLPSRYLAIACGTERILNTTKAMCDIYRIIEPIYTLDETGSRALQHHPDDVERAPNQDGRRAREHSKSLGAGRRGDVEAARTTSQLVCPDSDDARGRGHVVDHEA
jgi:hypothetical protein